MSWEIVSLTIRSEGRACTARMVLMPYLHLSASISLPGVSKHRRIKIPCWRTTPKASSSSRAWSSTGGGGDEAAMVSPSLKTLQARGVIRHYRRGAKERTALTTLR